MQKINLIITFLVLSSTLFAQNISSILYTKTAGNLAIPTTIEWENNNYSSEELSINIVNNGNEYKLTIEAKEKINFNLQNFFHTDLNYDKTNFLMPGFWYRKNLRSPKGAPSVKESNNWTVREDRLSSPLSGGVDELTGKFVTVLRKDNIEIDALGVPNYGEVILNGKTDLGSVGFGEKDNNVYLQFGYPYQEAPNTYMRKLTLAPSTLAFVELKKGEKIELNYEIIEGKTKDFASFVKNTWIYTYDKLKPQKVENSLSTAESQKILTKFYKQSFINQSELHGFSGAHISTAKCEKRQILEIGFIGRVLLNAYNALEYGGANNDVELVKIGNSVFDSYLKHGFKPSGFFREYVDFDAPYEDDVISIRRQSEGVYAVLLYLDNEKKQGREHKEWETKMKIVLANMLKLQHYDGSFPRKFDSYYIEIDPSGGSSPSAVLPLTMAYKYFGDKKYLASARKTAKYLEEKIVNKSDYFSSTLDADCEDKEASFYTATAYYYMSFVTKGKERKHYVELANKANYFVLSWYYNWDVPFAKGQMLGDVNFKTRGWGNVSVENNHVDVFIFGYLEVLRWLEKEKKEPRFGQMADVIESSMKSQLLPRKGHMFDIAKEGYYPEVVQHTNWDYGHFGKGFYNDIFAPGWTVASLWEMMMSNRTEDFFSK